MLDWDEQIFFHIDYYAIDLVSGQVPGGLR